MIVRYATIPVDPDRRDEALAAIDESVDRTSEEPGTVEYRPAADRQEPNTIRSLEQYEDEAAVEAHASSEHYREFVERLPVFLDGEIRVVGFDVESVTALDVSVGLDRRDGRCRALARAPAGRRVLRGDDRHRRRRGRRTLGGGRSS
jgi:quinol monooxygenase YgiN